MSYMPIDTSLGHPLQYAFCGNVYIGDTENLTDPEVRAKTRQQGAVDRYNRCPTCEQWSPCDVRRAGTDG
jgi:hypothetical protein